MYTLVMYIGIYYYPVSWLLVVRTVFVVCGASGAKVVSKMQAPKLPQGLQNGTQNAPGSTKKGSKMTKMGPEGFFIVLATLLGLLTVYGFYRMTQRGISDIDTSSYTTVLPTTSVVAMEIAQELAIEAAEEAEDTDQS